MVLELVTNQLRSGLVFPLGEIVGEIMIRYFSDATLKINERNSIGFFPIMQKSLVRVK